MAKFTRRALFAAAPIVAALSAPAFGESLSRGAFTHGVASGDPEPTRVILWTRFVPAGGAARGVIGWEVAEDEAFRRLVAQGRISVDLTSDWCAKLDAAGLQPGRRYFYRFLAASGASPTGLTRTAPAGRIDAVTLALFSCSNKPFGYFNAYRHAAARDDIDICIHVGDYIYEYPRGSYPSTSEAVADRLIEPETETVDLTDYHRRYASYRADPDLQELHRVKPFMTVWDDHELTNNAWIDGAENHQPQTEGDWRVRRVMAAKAYADWLPIRPQASLIQTYRRLDWGDLASFILLDTRLIGRDRQLDWRDALAPAMAEGEAAVAAAAQRFARETLANPQRSLLGGAQEAWLAAEMKRARSRGATWQVLAQQLVVDDQLMPAAAPGLLPASTSERTKQWVATGAGLGRLGLGWNLDAWSGYPAARARFLSACADLGANALILSGDSHNAWFNTLPAQGGRVAAVEMAGGSVTSPGMERTFSAGAPGAREAAMRSANPALAFCDATHRGYATARLTRAGLTSEWVAFAGVDRRDAVLAGVTRGEVEARPSGGPSGWRFA